MLIIAHRGASVQAPENTIESFHYAADNGADVIEMDVRCTADGTFVIFHDDTLKRVDGSGERICDLTYDELNQRLSAAGWPAALNLINLSSDYQRKTPLLFHVKVMDVEQELAAALDALPVHFYLGAGSLHAAGYFSQRYGRERVLGFIPCKEDAEAFIMQGAGIIRLWEQWLDLDALHGAKTEPAIAYCHRAGVVVWIMTRNSLGTGMTDETTMNYLAKSGADGVLLNDIHLARDWKKHPDKPLAKNSVILER